MKLFLIRHGETEHNIAGLLAGITDSNLTHHGVLQSQRLARYLVKDRDLQFTQIYASDLKRAFMTADEICKAHNEVRSPTEQIEVVKLRVLREQDFGSLELVSWSSRRDPRALDASIPNPGDLDFKPKETPEAMKSRAESFLNDFIAPLFATDDVHCMCVAVVSHGLFLASLWRSLLGKLKSENVTFDSNLIITDGHRSLHYRPAWSNTGFLEVEFSSMSAPNDHLSHNNSGQAVTSQQRQHHSAKSTEDHLELAQQSKSEKRENASSISIASCEVLPASTAQPDIETSRPLKNVAMSIKTINGKNHLSNFKRARGGLGSLVFDKRQTKLEGFFKKTKIEHKVHSYSSHSTKKPI